MVGTTGRERPWVEDLRSIGPKPTADADSRQLEAISYRDVGIESFPTLMSSSGIDFLCASESSTAVSPNGTGVAQSGSKPATAPQQEHIETKMNVYKAEYIWIDGTEPTALLRSKTKIVPVGQEPDVWGFDGSSTNQAPGDSSDCVLQPVRVVPDPVRGGDAKLVLCEVLNTDMTPHVSNTRAALRRLSEKYSAFECLYGIEQEYTFFDKSMPLGWPEGGYPAPQGPYYCAVGAESAYGRDIVEAHMDACLEAGLSYAGLNAEVMPGQWEYQIGAVDALTVSDEIWLSRWLLCRIAEDADVTVSFAPKPVKGDWNGAGLHTNFSTGAMRENYEAIIAGCEALGQRPEFHIANYGDGIAERLTGLHETCSYKEFRYGVSDRGASIRIPWHVAKGKKGYLEDRRPNANADPYKVTSAIMETVCAAAL